MRRILPLLLLFLPGLARAGVCPGEAPGCGWSVCGTPASPAPSFLWGELQPAETTIPPSRDSTDFNEFFDLYGVAHPQFFDLDIRDHYLYVALAWGLQIWDLHTDPARPSRLTVLSGPSVLRQWNANPEIKQPLRTIAAADSDMAVLGGVGTIGTAVFDATVKTAPRLLYQDAGPDVLQVASFSASGRTYGLAAAGPAGLLLYDLSATRSLSRCLDDSDSCPGVRRGRIGSSQAYSVATSGALVALGSGSAGGFELWDLAHPGAPRRLLSALASTPVNGLALWNAAGRLYLGLHTGKEGRIYDLGPILAPSTSPALLWSAPLPDGGGQQLVTYSSSGTTPFLYFGTDNRCGGGLQHEWLFDVSNPRQPRDLSPPPFGSGEFAESYWGWYYHGNLTGFNNLAPRVARFDGAFLYRAALSILDVHRWVPRPQPPHASFRFAPAQPAPGQLVQFTDTTEGTPDFLSWFFAGGVPGFAAGPAPAVTFSKVGSNRVDLTACNAAGCSSTSADVPVATFRDVPVSYWAWPWIEALAAARITTGCSLQPRLFCPESPVTRAEAAVFLTIARHGPNFAPPPAVGLFADVPISHGAAPWIEQLFRDGVTSGCAVSPRRFCPDLQLTRAEAAVLLEISRRGPTFVPPPPAGLFSDVPVSHWAARWIEQLVGDGASAGCSASPRLFCPDARLNRAQMAVLLARLFALPRP